MKCFYEGGIQIITVARNVTEKYVLAKPDTRKTFPIIRIVSAVRVQIPLNDKRLSFVNNAELIVHKKFGLILVVIGVKG